MKAVGAFLSSDSVDTDPAAGLMVMKRAIEIAINDGRLVIELSAHDWQQARRELTGQEWSQAVAGPDFLVAGRRPVCAEQ